MNQKLRNIRQILLAFTLLVAVSGFSSCEKYTYNPPAVDPVYPWSFQDDIQPIFNSKCVSCHGGVTSPNLSGGSAYQSLTRGNFITPPGESARLYTKMIAPDHISRSSETDRLIVLYWITQGALNN